MPEGPETWRTADVLSDALSGKVLTRVGFRFAQSAIPEARFTGLRVLAVRARGKALLTSFSNGWTLYSHNQLYGLWRVEAIQSEPDTRRSLRVELCTQAHAVRLYSASDISLWRSEQVEAHPYLQRIGPDVIDPSTTHDDVLGQLSASAFRKRRLAALLLDQSLLAGMGNYLRSEVLFEARLAADLRPCDLDGPELVTLAAALLSIPRRSYRARGIDSADGMRSDYTETGSQAFRFAVFGRDGAPCPRCGTRIERCTRSGRRLYLCPGCQPARQPSG